jgi:hypothetical protein
MLSRVSEIGLVIPGFAGNIKVFIVMLECIWTVARPRLFAVTLNEWFKASTLFWITSVVTLDILQNP